MSENRNDFYLSLLFHLKETYNQLHNLTTKIKTTYSTYFEQISAEQRELIEKEVTTLKTNIAKIKQYNYKITEEINKWHQFSTNPQEVAKTLYPIKFFIKRFQLNNKIHSINKNIYRTSVENRLAKENLKKIENSIEKTILDRLKDSGIYKEYEETLSFKEILISDLKYLLPTLTSPPPELDLANLDSYLAPFNSPKFEA